MLACLPQLHHVFHDAADIADNAEVNPHGLVHGTAVNIDMDLLGMRRKGIQTARHPIIKARAKAEDEIGLIHRPIGFIGAVHAQHAEPLIARRRIRAKAH